MQLTLFFQHPNFCVKCHFSKERTHSYTVDKIWDCQGGWHPYGREGGWHLLYTAGASSRAICRILQPSLFFQHLNFSDGPQYAGHSLSHWFYVKTSKKPYLENCTSDHWNSIKKKHFSIQTSQNLIRIALEFILSLYSKGWRFNLILGISRFESLF